MKKIFTFIILICICFIPSVVDAKVSYEVNWRKDGETLLGEKDDKLYFIENVEYMHEIDRYDIYNEIYFNIYDKNGKFLKKEKEYDSDETLLSDFIKTDYHYYLMGYLDNYYNNFYDKKTRYLYNVNYYYKEVNYNSIVDNKFTYNDLYFETDLDEVKRILGKRYDIYTELYDSSEDLECIYEFGDYYVVIFDDEEDDLYKLDIIDKDLNFVMNLSYDNYNEIPFVFDLNGFIVLVSDLGEVNIYKSDGTFYDSFEIDTSFLDDPNGTCGNYEITKVFVKNMDLIINYNFEGCPTRMILEDDFVGGMSSPKPYSLNLRLKFDIQKEENKGGSFTYEETYDDEGRGIVELRITPDKGYTVKEIIVTDINGNKIEVTDNKFIMPMSDVKVEVKYEYGEYVPIPDTFLGKSVILIFIGLILVSLGLYTINYVRQE